MLIRKATLNDVPAIMRIAESRLKEESVPSSSGFFRLDLSEADYRERIKDNPLAFVADYESPVGFLIGYTSRRLRELARANKSAASDELIACALNFEDPFAYVDLFAVLKEYERKNIGQALDDRALEEIGSLGLSRVYGAIADENIRVINFYNERGQDFMCPVVAKGIPFGMYTRDLIKIRQQKQR